MASIFTRSNDRVADVKRNSFDLSFQNNLTMKFGALYPVFCKEVIPGDTFKITPTFALEFLPMVFPVQTRMRANLHFFYVRNRNLWKDFMDFIGDTKQDLDPPYLDFNNNYKNYADTCSLGDYLGIPTTIVGDYGNESEGYTCDFEMTKYNDKLNVIPPDTNTLEDFQSSLFANPKLLDKFVGTETLLYDDTYITTWVPQFPSETISSLDFLNGFSFKIKYNCDAGDVEPELQQYCNFEGLENIPGFVLGFANSDGTQEKFFTFFPNTSYLPQGCTYSVNLSSDKMTLTYTFNCPVSSEVVKYLLNADFGEDNQLFMTGTVVGFNLGAGYQASGSYFSNPSKRVLYPNTFEDYRTCVDVSVQFIYNGDVVRPLNEYSSPYFDSSYALKNKQLKISALPFRAYESVYNAFYRDQRNNPFMINGVPEYNKYIPTQEGGIDITPYKLRYRNWEQDFLTTAVQSPQQGIAPLVGITSLGTMTFADDNGSYQVQAKFADDGETITSFKVLDKGIPNANIRSLVDMVSSGISINDLRNVNSLQRWLEANMRKGLRYKDQVKAHYNVDIRYDELDMPEFIGGTSEDVRINMVTQTSSDVEGSPLGSYAGQATCVGTSNHKISHYCDEHGFIIGILSVTPVPNYSQLLPKHLIKRNVLDYFFPEFGHIGFQPIRYNEVCPVQAYNDSMDSLNDTFGYQRAWYDYLASTDEVHGLFRTSLRNYVMNRVFDLKPSLSESFLLVDPKQLNEVFASTLENDDKIIGQVYFDVEAYRPIPQFGIPRLE